MEVANASSGAITGLPEDEGKPSSRNDKRSFAKNKKKDSFKGKSRDKSKGVTTNDPAYYAKYPDLLESSAHLNYSDPYGKLVKWENTSINGITVVGNDANSTARSVPGVLTIRTKPTYGYSDNAKSPLNVAAATLYVDLRYKVSGRKNYDACDVFMYLASVAELYSAVNWASRFYSLAFQASQTNQFISTGLAKAMHVNLNDLRSNLANFRYWLNSFIEKVSCYAIPKGITFFDKKVDEYSYVYIENNDNNIKDQLYVKIPHGFHKFQLDSDGAGMLHFEAIPYGSGVGLSAAGIQNICEGLLTNIWNDEDFALISGDIIKAYEGSIIGLTNIGAEADLGIVYDEMFLLQLKNSTPVLVMDGGPGAPTYNITGVTGSTITCTPGDVYQDKNGIIHARNSAQIAIDLSSTTDQCINVGLLQHKIIDQKSPNPGLFDNIESTRMMVSTVGVASNMSTAGFAHYWLNTPAYVIVGLEMVFMQNSGNDRMGNPTIFNAPLGNIQTMGYWLGGSNLERYMVTFFKFFPNLRVVALNASSSGNYCAYMYFLTNLDNFTWVDNDTLDKMHDCAWLSMLAVEGVAKVKNTLV